MNTNILAKSLALSALLGLATTGHAASSNPLEAKGLTPVGAELAGNKSGTIPAWTGGLPANQATMAEDGSMVNPYADDKVLFTITAENLDQYRDQLSAGQLAMFERHPKTFTMNIYPTRRSASYPESVYQNTLNNLGKAQLQDNGNGLIGFNNGVPFPQPENGLQAIWNHMLRYRGDSVDMHLNQVIAEADGSYREILKQTVWNFYPSIEGLEDDHNLLYYYKSKVLKPIRMAGEVTLVHEPVNQIAEPRRAWKYIPGQRRVRRAPNIAYDNPAASSDNLKTSDNIDMFNGAPDRYEWTLKGKKELYIPYNSYALYDRNVDTADMIQPGHINPELVRYELHRVWEVEATLKDDARHIYGKRTFHIDEDSWQIALADLYDSRGQIWRVGMAYSLQFNPAQVPWMATEVFYDMNSNRYITNGPAGSGDNSLIFGKTASKTDYTPAAIRRWGR
ncbi:DUF1329 domain-containing protein [Parendozoicomonas haliclonae]|uniref:Outer membrane lipoprotein-sorting protein n=1 Tax=Parendozoicomonas haliclonae TaxID=1960125 RepID=A0A1X7AR87_9GAMM|nr:DUF1329 domain-containing protein [Parendozoicomonas haliclonae]SMA50831.1 hypothetical protein EHSB41UT_04648 [Parendozoicomonas haliclonae]